MPGYTEWTISLKTLRQSVWSKYKPFLNQYVEKNSAGKFYMDEWIKYKKRENTIAIWGAVCQHKNNPWVRYLHAGWV